MVPHGLFGVTNAMARVRGVMSCRAWSTVGEKPLDGDRGRGTGVRRSSWKVMSILKYCTMLTCQLHE